MVIASTTRHQSCLDCLFALSAFQSLHLPMPGRANRQGTYVGQGYPNLTPSITAMPRNTPKANIVCWTPCGQPGAIVMGADPDPFIRSQILRDASGFFGGTK